MEEERDQSIPPSELVHRVLALKSARSRARDEPYRLISPLTGHMILMRRRHGKRGELRAPWKEAFKDTLWFWRSKFPLLRSKVFVEGVFLAPPTLPADGGGRV